MRCASACSSLTAPWAPSSMPRTQPSTTSAEPALEGWMDGLSINAPQIVERVHRGFLEAGCDVIETCTFQATRPRLEEWGQGDVTIDLNVSAARLARRIADEYAADGRPRFVAGSMGPTGFLPGLERSVDEPAGVRRPCAGLPRAGRLAHRGWRRRPHHRDAAGHSRDQGGRLRRPRSRCRGGTPGRDHDHRLARRHRPHAARHRCGGGARHPRVTPRRRHRVQLLHRAGAHARTDPLHHLAYHAAGRVHPQCGIADQRRRTGTLSAASRCPWPPSSRAS